MSAELIDHQRPPDLPYGGLVVPSLVADQGERAAKRYIEFFAANIRSPNTHRAYARAASDFLGWCEQLDPAPPRPGGGRPGWR